MDFTLCLDCLPLVLCGLNVLVVVDHLVNICILGPDFRKILGKILRFA